MRIGWIAITVCAGAACTLRPVDDAGSGTSEGGSGATSTTSAGGASGCAAEPTCDGCRLCAAEDRCAGAIAACLDDPLCTSLDECITLCGETFECRDLCISQYEVSADLYLAARGCVDCDVCFDACATAVFCEP
jgi:hypothetical protein